MNARLTLIFVTLVLVLGTMIWLVQDRRNLPITPAMATAPAMALPVPPTIEEASAPTIVAEIPQHKSAPMVHVDASGKVKYVAREGDTASQLAVALLGSDSKEHRDAVVAANPSLQTNPDRVLTGTTYTMAAQVETEVVESQPKTTAPVAAAKAPVVSEGSSEVRMDKDKGEGVANSPKMKYMAQKGDTLGVLASDLLGANTKNNRDAIIAQNASLQQDPNHLVAGKSYTIVAANGLAADPAAPQAKAPTSQPDADDVILANGARSLRYTAKPGDTVSKLAEVLLGSDTKANRDLIINVNPSLKQDPDTLIAGRTYWISVPTAD